MVYICSICKRISLDICVQMCDVRTVNVYDDPETVRSVVKDL